MELKIKNMVCPRCIKVVRDELENLGFKIEKIELGYVELKENPNEKELEKISGALEKEGFELLKDYKSKLIDEIKTEIISLIQKYKYEDLENLNFSKYLAEYTGKDYNYISTLFSKTEGITIEHFIILQKIEKAKELLEYDELTLSEISYMLGYSSVQHLSAQFKKVTGLTASQYKKEKTIQRKPIDKLI